MTSAIVLSHRNVADVDLLVGLGSPNSVASGDCEQPEASEIAMVGEWIKHDRPFLGVCFGSQVLAQALGGSVRRMENEYRSYTPMNLTSNSPPSLNGSWALWHEDAISAPANSRVLATMPYAPIFANPCIKP